MARQIVKTQSEILWSFDNHEIIYKEGVVELSFIMKNPRGYKASLASFQFYNDYASEWVPASLDAVQYVSLGGFPLSGKFEKVIIRWDCASDLRIMKAFQNVRFAVAFNDREELVGTETELREYTIPEVDFTIQDEPRVIRPHSNDPYLIFEFLNPKSIRDALLHFKLEVDTVDTFDSQNLVSFSSFDDQTGWQYVLNGAWTALPSEGLSGLQFWKFKFEDASLTALTGGDYYFRITPVLSQIQVHISSIADGQVFQTTTIPVNGSVVILD